MTNRAVGLQYTFSGKNYEVIRAAQQDEVGPSHLVLDVPDHWVVRDEDGTESRVSDWFIEHLATEVKTQ